MRKTRAAGRAAPVQVELTEPACWSWEGPDREFVRRKIIAEAEITGFGWHYLEDEEWLRWLTMCEFHAERCAICGRRTVDRVWDHDQATGLIRGFLCNRCNVLEGVSISEAFVKYRERNPASICGVREVYVYGRTQNTVVPYGE
jgi:Recombination endonuclease VII